MATEFEYLDTGEDSSAGAGGVTWRGQSFTIGTVGSNVLQDTTEVHLWLFRLLTPGTMNVTIKAVDGSGFPTGAALSSGTYDADSLGTLTTSEITVTMTPAANLSPSTKYVISVSCPSGTFGVSEVQWGRDDAGGYAGGNGIFSNDSGATWADSSAGANDFLFEIWGNQIAAGPANLKSYNTNLKANIKSIDTNLIANVKTFDTNT